jgi:hypothetical protein
MKPNIETTTKIKLYFFIVEEIILLSIGIYYLVNNDGIIIFSFIILITGILISLLKNKISKVELQKGKNTYTGKRFVYRIIIYLFFIIVSMLRKKILAKYFIGQQMIILTIWFITGVLIGNIIAHGILLTKIKTKKTSESIYKYYQ